VCVIKINQIESEDCSRMNQMHNHLVHLVVSDTD